MKEELAISNSSKLLLSFDEYGFQEVVDDFDNTDFIGIVTYNLSAVYKPELLKLLKKIKKGNPDIKITVITNIPGRWDYKNDKQQENVFKSIKSYCRLLDDYIAGGIETYFNFDNHSKIFLTDNIAYIGSANFSNGSKSNYEMGTIIYDQASVNEIKKKMFELIKKESIYYSIDSYYELSKAFLEQTINECNRIITSIEENLITEYDFGYRGSYYGIDFSNGDIPISDWNSFIELYSDVEYLFDELLYKFDEEINNTYIPSRLKALEKTVSILKFHLNEIGEFNEMKEWDSNYEHYSDVSLGLNTGEPEDTERILELADERVREKRELILDKLNQNLGVVEKGLDFLKYLFDEILDELDGIQEIKRTYKIENERLINNTEFDLERD
ncbi:phospholipase D-like domain-containing protein [Robertmurraya beringensis]|uniref:Phospholipase D-like domain-containing protein n=1 Tax=Robertmurraya beringensis TaxID=641660 RepID=A0ABV6KRN3_9BACI